MTARFISSVLRGRSSALVAVALVATAVTTAQAATIFSSNLSAVTVPGNVNPSTGKNFQLGIGSSPVGSVSGITNTNFAPGIPGYNFVFAEGSTPAQIASNSNLIGATINGGVVKLDSATTADTFLDTHDNGAFLALDSVYQKSAITIALSTQVGVTYTVMFDWAGTQQTGYVGPTTDQLTVGFTGNPDQTTMTTAPIPTQGFSGWMQVTDTFVATSANTTLSFLASGTPTGVNQQPAFTLLDNIVVSSVTPPPPTIPEPNSLLLLSTGLVGLGGFIRSRYHKS